MTSYARQAKTNPDVIEDGRTGSSAVYSRRLQELIDQFDGEPLDVKVRQIVGPLPANELTHGIFPYPARLVRHIPRFFLGARQVTEAADFIVDPFCGSGTVLLEAQRYGYETYGFDQNPLAVLISQVKTHPYNGAELLLALEDLIRRAKSTRQRPQIPGWIEKWYSKPSASVLGRAMASRDNELPKPVRNYLDLTVALAARKLSHADPRIPVPVRIKDPVSISSPQAWEILISVGASLASRIDSLPKHYNYPHIESADMRKSEHWTALPAKRGVLFTSPPYGASQKYIRSTSLENAWLQNFHDKAGKQSLERASIGREYIRNCDFESGSRLRFSNSLLDDLLRLQLRDPVRHRVYSSYFSDMQAIVDNVKLSQCIKTIVLVTGDNQVAGERIRTGQHLAEMFTAAGFTQVLDLRDEISGRVLITRRRNGRTPTACEHVRILTRDSD